MLVSERGCRNQGLRFPNVINLSIHLRSADWLKGLHQRHIYCCWTVPFSSALLFGSWKMPGRGSPHPSCPRSTASGTALPRTVLRDRCCPRRTRAWSGYAVPPRTISTSISFQAYLSDRRKRTINNQDVDIGDFFCRDPIKDADCSGPSNWVAVDDLNIVALVSVKTIDFGCIDLRLDNSRCTCRLPVPSIVP